VFFGKLVLLRFPPRRDRLSWLSCTSRVAAKAVFPPTPLHPLEYGTGVQGFSASRYHTLGKSHLHINKKFASNNETKPLENDITGTTTTEKPQKQNKLDNRQPTTDNRESRQHEQPRNPTTDNRDILVRPWRTPELTSTYTSCIPFDHFHFASAWLPPAVGYPVREKCEKGDSWNANGKLWSVLRTVSLIC